MKRKYIRICPDCFTIDDHACGKCCKCSAETEMYRLMEDDKCACGPNEKCDNCRTPNDDHPEWKKSVRVSNQDMIEKAIDASDKAMAQEAELLKAIKELTEQLKQQPVCVPYYPFPYIPPSVPEWSDYPSTSGGPNYTITCGGGSCEPAGKWVWIKSPKKGDDEAGQACKA